MTQVARRCHAPSPNGLGCRMGTRMLLMRASEDREHRGQQRDRVQHGDGDDDRAGDAHRHQCGAGVEEQAGEADRDGEAAEHDRAPRGGHGGAERVLDAVPRAELFAEPRDDEQRIVDRDPEPDQRHDVHRVRRDIDDVRERERRAHAAEHREDADAEAQQRGDAGGEDDDEQDQCEWERHHLGPAQVAREIRVEVVGERDVTGRGDAERRGADLTADLRRTARAPPRSRSAFPPARARCACRWRPAAALPLRDAVTVSTAR